jgi:catechol 2,3-dioxygenase-like lactoylglutathione lyase family enzyme
MRLKHVNLTARDAQALASFYTQTFEFAPGRPPQRLSGDSVARGNGLAGSDSLVIRLDLDDLGGPFLEIMEYTQTLDRPWPAVSQPGYGHLAFEVADLDQTVETVLRFCGSLQGEVTHLGPADAIVRVVYVRDPEGNILELEEPARPRVRAG